MKRIQGSDIYSVEKRSAVMRSVKGRNTRPERLLRHELHRLGFRYSLKPSPLPGTPDIVLRKYRTVIFVHGCFWHRHVGCRKTTLPINNRSFWRKKFAGNIKRDVSVRASLNAGGWKVIVAWECEILKDPGGLANVIWQHLPNLVRDLSVG